MTVPDESDLLAVAALAVAVDYVAYPQPCRWELVTATGTRTVELEIGPGDTAATLAGRIADAPPAPDGDRPVFRVTLAPDGPATPHGHTLRLRPGPPHSVTVEHDGDPGDEVATLLRRIAPSLLSAMTGEPDRPVGRIPLLDDAGRELLAAANDTARDFPDDLTLDELLRRQATERPDAVAISADQDRLTFGELDERSTRLAGYLSRHGAQPGQVVALLADRCPQFMVAVFAILKAGCAYLPLDSQAPVRRNAELVAQSGAAVVLTVGGGTTPDVPAKVFDLDDPELYRDASGPTGVSAAADLAYVIYTSGSTGRPKGVMVEHRSVVNRLAWMQRRYPLGPGDVLLQKTPTIFDVSVWELFWWLFSGSRLHLPAPGMEKFPMALTEIVHRENVTVIHFVPSMLRAYLDHLASAGAESLPTHLRWIFSSGEILPAETVNAFTALFEGAGTRLVNLYGPTETTVDVTAYDCPPGPVSGRVPIGKPIDNTRCHVLRHGNPLPPGLFGVLHVAGAGVARGYLGDEALTKARFVPESDGDGRMYDTGDIVRHLPSGELEFLGRADLQIKIRGVRVDPAEIENELLGAPGVVECAVHLDQREPDLAVLHASVTGDPGRLSARELRAHLAERLPAYLIPAVYHRFDAFPRTGSGKVDRRALQDREFVATVAQRL
ncbi:amino acid adenylation domain-containing protein [Actinoplanes sp. CA-252034]|uniref:amino acid adenylation domain-containing protein n=1 Tax=Actinoplanes sp. CA-252034 TaxID=3239906 RepID=UPI003D97CFEE